MQKTKPWEFLAAGILTASFLAPLAAHAYIGLYSRFMADDYCSAYLAQTNGLLGATFFTYMNWTGRYSANFLDSLAGLFGPYARPFVPAAVILVWGAALGLVFYQARLAVQNRARVLLAALLATLVLFTTLSSTPVVSQSLYWGQGMRSLAPPLILLVVYAGILCACWQDASGMVRLSRARFLILLGFSFGLAFTAAGFSETGAVLQITLLGLAFLIGFLAGGAEFRKRMLPLLAAGLLGSLLALAAIVAAPGNIAREEFFPRHPGFVALVKITLHSELKFILQAGAVDTPFDLPVFAHRSLSLAGAVILPALIGLGAFGDTNPQPVPQKKWMALLAGIPLAAGLLTLSCFVPAAYALSAGPPNRTKIIPVFLLVCALVSWGYVLGRILSSRSGAGDFFSGKRFLKAAVGMVFAVLAINAVWDAYRVFQTAPAFRSYAAAWDQNHQKILARRAEGKAHVVVQPLQNPAGLDEIARDSRFWVNKCASSYYGVRLSSSRGEDQILPVLEYTKSDQVP